MSQPFQRLDRISEISKNGGTVNGLYRLMYHEKLWIKAYCRLSKNPGNMSKGVDGNNISGTGLQTIHKLMGQIKAKKFRFRPVKRTFIPKNKGGKRPLGIMNFEDKLVQEVMRIILESAYEPKFVNNSHGFRPNLSCHTAIDSIRNYWSGVSWFIEGDIEGCYDNICHKTLLEILARHIKDKSFLRQIHDLLKCGYIENLTRKKTLSGAIQGSGISPLLANIYLHELDEYVQQEVQKFFLGKRRSLNPEYQRLSQDLKNIRRKIKYQEEKYGKQFLGREILTKQICIKRKEMLQIPACLSNDPSFKRLHYIRYADDILLGISGSKQDCIKIKSDLTNFLSHKLKLTLSPQKTKITNSSKSKARFLNFNISVSNHKVGKVVSFTDKNGRKIKKRSTTRMIRVTIPKDVFPKFFGSRSYGDYFNNRPSRRKNLVRNSDLEIFMQINTELRGIFNYYAVASFASPIFSRAEWFAQRTLCRTLANKHRKPVAKVVQSLKNSHRRLTMNFNSKQYKFVSTSDYKGKLGKILFKKSDTNNPDRYIPSLLYSGSTELEQRLLAKQCESCDKTQGPFCVHHIRRVKDILHKKEKHWLDWIHITRQRRTVVLCRECHLDYHHGSFRGG